MNELDLFIAVNSIADPAERADYLERVCADQPELRQRLEALLAGNAQSRHPLEQPPCHPQAPADFTRTFGNPEGTNSFRPAPSAEEAEGTVIAGRYKLRQQIGEGGMGTVWMADQTEPVKRKVAVKLIRVERAHSKTILARFEAERQAIALMDHPHIAKLLDAGTTESGSPFFVMELVKGIPLSDYCDQHRLTIAERLNLFQQICSAVQHAHQKGIIHRDLKPSNILVESHDGKPVPKVIDFGLAKATTGLQLTEQSMFTAFGSVMGTPLYMAPEQATFNAVDVDTRADVYALGVILYELLTGTTPITRESLKKAALDEMLRLVREQEAPTPSSRLSSSDSLPSVSANRQIEPAKLGRFVKGELDWIVLKALSKDRDRRYETANSFAKDIERFLNHEPVTAGPPTASYRFQKFIRRNKGQVIAASLVLLALFGGIAGTSVGLYQANQARYAEAQQRAKAEGAAEEEKRAKEVAVRNLDFAKKGNELLSSVFTGLDPKAKYDTVGEFREALQKNLKKAVAELDGSAIGDPLDVAAMQNTLGQSLLGLREVKLAVEVFEKARDTRMAKLGPDDPETLNSMTGLACSYLEDGQLNKALPLMEETLKRKKANLGPNHPKTLISMNDLAGGYLAAGQFDKAVQLYEETLRLMKAEPDTERRNILTTMSNLAECYRAAKMLDKAVPLGEETLQLKKAEFGPNDPGTLTTMHNLAAFYRTDGQLDKALPLLEEAFKRAKDKLGAEHRDTLLYMYNLGECYYSLKRLDKSVPLFEELLPLSEKKFGRDHQNTQKTVASLGANYSAAVRPKEAIPLLEEAYRASKKFPEVRAGKSLSIAYVQTGQHDKAVPLLEETLKLTKAEHGLDHPDTHLCMGQLGHSYYSLKRLDKSVPLYEELLPLFEKQQGRMHLQTQMTVANLGVNYKAAGRLKEAIPLLEEAYQASKKFPDLGRRWVGESLFDAYSKAGKPAEALKLIDEMLADARKNLPKDSPQLGGMMAQFGVSLLEMKGYTEAEPLLRECLTIREKTQPDAWTTFNTQSLLGGALLGQKKYTDAEPLLLKGYEGLKAREKQIPPPASTRLPEALDRLIELYTAMNKPDEVKKWRAERAKYPTPKEVAPPPREKK